MNPRPSSRISSLEKRATTIEAAIEEMAGDTAEEFKALRQEIKQGHLDIGKALDSHEGALMQEIRTRFDSADRRLTAIETTQAEHSKRFDRLETTLQEILARLPKQE